MEKIDTKKYLPFNCISPNLLKNPDFPDFPFLSGTGFFCYFPPYEYIFYVTAKHCLLKDSEIEIYEYLKVPYSNESFEEPPLAVVFSEYFGGKDEENLNGYEDILVFVVDNNVNKGELKILKKRAVALSHQDDVDEVITKLCNVNGNIRTIGFSQPSNINEENNKSTLSEHEHTSITDVGNKKKLIMRPRSFYGKIKNNSTFEHRYGFEETNWRDEEYRGFSGSPVISLVCEPHIYGGISMRIIGIMLTATKSRGEFLSINIATNFISGFINRELSLSSSN